MKYTYTAVLTPSEDGTYVARIGSIPGLVVQGYSYSDALHQLELALNDVIDEYHARREPPPPDTGLRNVLLSFGARMERISVNDTRVRRLLDDYLDEADDWY